MASKLDQPITSALNQKPFSYEEGMDPRVVAYMKQYGIWHPAMSLSPGSAKHPNPQYVREQQLMAHIQDMIVHQDQLRESQATRGQQSEETRKAHAEAVTEAEKGRNERAQAVQESRQQQLHDQKVQGLATALGHLDPGSPEHKAILNQYLKLHGIEIPATVDPKTTAAAAFAKSKGLPTTQPTATSSSTSFSPSNLVSRAPEAPHQSQEITGKVYGTSIASPDMLPADVIGQRYGGKSEIPNDGAPGYYKNEQFVGPFSGGYVPGSTGIKGDRNDPTGVPMTNSAPLINMSPITNPQAPTQPATVSSVNSFPSVNALVQPAPPNNLVQNQPPAPAWWPPGANAGTTSQILGTAPQQPAVSIADRPEMQDFLARLLSSTLFKKGNPWQ